LVFVELLEPPLKICPGGFPALEFVELLEPPLKMCPGGFPPSVSVELLEPPLKMCPDGFGLFRLRQRSAVVSRGSVCAVYSHSFLALPPKLQVSPGEASSRGSYDAKSEALESVRKVHHCMRGGG
jgi:hypothetical protein